MNLKEIISNSEKYEDSDDTIYVIYAKKIGNKFIPDSEAIILELSPEEMEINVNEIANSKCPGFDYFLEMFILQDFDKDLMEIEEFKNNLNKKIDRIIYYAENNA